MSHLFLVMSTNGQILILLFSRPVDIRKWKVIACSLTNLEAATKLLSKLFIKADYS